MEIVKFLAYFALWVASGHLLEKYKVSSNICMFAGYIFAIFSWKMYN